MHRFGLWPCGWRSERPALAAVALSGLVAVASPAASAPPQAQGGSPPASSSAARAGGPHIEEIVVTAQKREESAQLTPVAVSAIRSLTLEETRVETAPDLAMLAPNLTLVRNISGTAGISVFMRGLGNADPTLAMDPFVGVYVDDVYLAKSVGSLFDLLDLERVEVLRGPQGTLYGKNNVGGAIKLVTRKPTGEWGFRLVSEYGNHTHRLVRGTVDFPVIRERLAGKVSFLHVASNGFGRNPLRDYHFDNEGTLAARAALRWTPTDAITVDYVFDGTRRRTNTRQNQLTWVDPTNPLVQTMKLIGEDLSAYVRGDLAPKLSMWQPRQREDLDLQGHSLTLRWDAGEHGPFDDLALTSISAYRRIVNDAVSDVAAAPFPVGPTQQITEHSQLSEELRLNFTALGHRVEGVLGGFFLNEKGSYDDLFLLFPDLAAPPFNLGFLSNHNRLKIHNDSLAAFVDATWHLSDRLSIGAGVRYTLEHKAMRRSQINPFDPQGIFFPPSLFEPIVGFDDTITFVNWSPSFTVSYRWTDDLMTYVRGTRGFRSGSWNSRNLRPPVTPAGDATVYSLEVGVKSRWLEDRLQLNATGFYQKALGLQFSVFDPTPTGIDLRLENAGSAKYLGAEIELLAQPVEGLTLDSALSIIRPDFQRFDDPVRGDLSDVAGFPFTPHYSLYTSLRYTFPPLPFGRLTVRLDHYAQTKMSFLVLESSDRMDQGRYALLNARVELSDLKVPGVEGRASLYLYAHNLTNRDYRDGGIDFGSLGFMTNNYGDPRTFGAGLRFEWGSGAR